MSAALDKVQNWFSGRQLPPLQQSFAWTQRLPLAYWQRALVLICVLIIALSLAKLFWLLFTPTVDPAPASLSAPAISAKNTTTDNSSINIAELKALDLFGNAEQVAVETAAEPEQQEEVIAAEETKLALVLNGIVGSSDEDAARAIIANGNQQDIYAPGDRLPVGNRVTLHQVLNDRVILNNSGRYESLLLYEEGESFSSASRPTPSTQQRTTRTQPAIAISKEDRQAIASGNIPESVNDIIKLTVAREGSKVIGYRVRPGRYRQLFDEFGFKTGDIVTHVNGLGVDDPAKAMSVYRDVRTAELATFDVLRDGELFNLEVDLTNLDIDEN